MLTLRPAPASDLSRVCALRIGAVATTGGLLVGCVPVMAPAVEVTEFVTQTVTVAPEPTDPDWSQFPIIVNGVGVAAAPRTLDEASIFPTHVPLQPVLEAFATDLPSTEVTLTADPATGEVTRVHHYGLGGRDIEFLLDDPVYSYGYDEFTDLSQEPGATIPTSSLIDGQIYVPLLFSEMFFGAEYVAVEGGHVIISTIAPADMN